MKTGNQSRVFDYDTGSVDTNSGPIPQDFKLEKPAQASVDIDLIGETFEQRLVRLGKIAPRPEDRGGNRMSSEVQEEMYDRHTTPEGFTLVTRRIPRRIKIYDFQTEVH